MAPHAGTDDKNEYRVLARKYRPTTFSQLIGQEAMVKTLSNAIDVGRLAHAFILTGVRGVGKTTTARLIARALNCIGADGKGNITVEPCGVCENCVAIGESRHVDILEMDAASRTGVDDVREIIESVRYAPTAARFKVYIIDEVHMLSRNAFNALLKTLEEPPPHVKFIFATTEIRKLPVTVLSRCQRFDLRRVEAEELIAHLARISKEENVEIEDQALAMIARAAEGSVRDSLSLLDQAIAHTAGKISADQVRDMMGLADRARVLDLMHNIMAGDVEAALKGFQEQYNLGADPTLIIKDLAELTHWLTRLKVVPSAGTDSLVSEAELKDGRAMAEKLTMAQLTRAWQLLLKGLLEVQSAANPVITGEMLIIRLCFAADLPSPADLIQQIEDNPAAQAAPSAGTQSAVAAPTASAAKDPSPSEAIAPLLKSERDARGQSDPIDQPTAQSTGQPINSGAQVLALSPADLGDYPEEPLPTSFAKMVKLFSEKREGILAMHLAEDVRLVAYKPGQISINPIRQVPQNFAARMRDCLKRWTGIDWQIIIASDGGSATLREEEDAVNAARLAAAKSDPLVARILEHFEGSEIIDMMPLGRDAGTETLEEEDE